MLSWTVQVLPIFFRVSNKTLTLATDLGWMLRWSRTPQGFLWKRWRPENEVKKISTKHSDFTFGCTFRMYMCHCFLVFSDFINMRIWFCGSESKKKCVLLDVNQQTFGCLWILSNKHEDATWVSVSVPMKHDKPGNPHISWEHDQTKAQCMWINLRNPIAIWVRCRVWILGIKVQVQPPSIYRFQLVQDFYVWPTSFHCGHFQSTREYGYRMI
jgi:hypothetical protein